MLFKKTSNLESQKEIRGKAFKLSGIFIFKGVDFIFDRLNGSNPRKKFRNLE